MGALAGLCGVIALLAATWARPPAPAPAGGLAPTPLPAEFPAPSAISAAGMPAPIIAITADPDRDAEELAEVMRLWIDGTGAMPNLDRQRGVTYLRGAQLVDHGCGYVTIRPRESTHVCGSPTRWLRDALRTSLATQTIHCGVRACSWGRVDEPGAAGFAQFRLDDGIWTLVAWTELFPTGADGASVAAESTWAARIVRGQSTSRCAGATPGSVE